METISGKLQETLAYLRDNDIGQADTGIVLGTGLARFIEHMDVLKTIPYHQIPNFPISTVEFHKGNLVYGTVGNSRVLAMQGRFHYYEGYTMQQITFPIRILKMLGVRHLLLSNASGGINSDLKKGDLVYIDDHINLQSANPLTGNNLDDLGPRFPDMSSPYSETINKALIATALSQGIQLKKGVYAAVNGPNLETRAEYRFLKIIGADLVGMSTVPEVIVANHMGLPCAAVSVVTDECNPDNLHPVNIEEIIAVAGKADHTLSGILADCIRSLSS